MHENITLSDPANRTIALLGAACTTRGVYVAVCTTQVEGGGYTLRTGKAFALGCGNVQPLPL